MTASASATSPTVQAAAPGADRSAGPALEPGPGRRRATLASRLALPPMSPSKDPADYAVFQGSISRWGWRMYTQRLTHAGRWFLLVTAAFSAYGGTSLLIQAYVLAAYASAIWWVALVAAWLYRPKVRLTARHADRVCAGQTLPVDVTVEQRGRLRGADLVVVPHHLPPSIDAEPEFGAPLPDLARGKRERIRIHLRCNRRGAYTLRGFRVETSFPFGILRARSLLLEERKVLVYPKFAALSRLLLPTGRRYQPGGVALASQLGESFEYLGNREYREGDAVKDIDWRATARVGRPIVREWVEEYMLRVAVVLDTHVPKDLPRKELATRREAFERAVCLAASVSDYMARQDYLVDLFAAGPYLYHLTAGRSLAYLDQILDILACVDENPDEPFATIEPQIAELLSRISTVICVFMDFDEARRAFVQQLTQQGVGVKVIIARDADPTLDPSADAEALGPVAIVSGADFEKGVDEL